MQKGSNIIIRMNQNTRNYQSSMNVMDSFDFHMFIMVHLCSILLFLILLAVAIPVGTYIFHTVFESYKRRRDEAVLRKIEEARRRANLTTIIVKTNMKTKFLHSIRIH